MRVTCAYCDSLVEADDAMRCPNCGGDLRDAVAAATAEQERQAAAESARMAQAAEAEARRRTMSEVIRGVASVAGAVALSGPRPRRNRGMPPAPPPKGVHRPGVRPGDIDGGRPDGPPPDGMRPGGHRPDMLGGRRPGGPDGPMRPRDR